MEGKVAERVDLSPPDNLVVSLVELSPNMQPRFAHSNSNDRGAKISTACSEGNLESLSDEQVLKALSMVIPMKCLNAIASSAQDKEPPILGTKDSNQRSCNEQMPIKKNRRSQLQRFM